MLITGLEIRSCQVPGEEISVDSLNGQNAPRPLEYLVYIIRTDVGIEVSSFGFAGASASGSAALAKVAFEPLLLGQDPLDREKIWREFRVSDRCWNHLPIYCYGPIDICLWLIAARAARSPLYKYIGANSDEVETYCRLLVLSDIDAYCDEAVSVRDAGYKAYKIHPPGKDVIQDIELHRAVRHRVGNDFVLMSDPVAPYSFEESIKLGQELEKLNYLRHSKTARRTRPWDRV